MNHLIVSREYPPCSYPQGGIGTYVAHVARLLAEHGETVHVIAERWKGAPLAREESCEGRLIVHRVPLDQPLPALAAANDGWVLDAMRRSHFGAQAFAWQVARLAESLVEEAGIDCIEGQDFEAPLYYFLLRRALGLGPTRQPPCFVHLHSPMQFICHHNDWDIGGAGHLAMKRLEDYVIQASDAALCPSRYLGRQVEHHYGLPPSSVARIPYPKGGTPLIERTAETWERGVITYFGRMEPRKGVFEWIDAAVAVARERPGLRFELIGADTPLTGGGGYSVREAVRQRVPTDLQASIAFLDAMPRSQLFERLAQARFAVVPSRWENFPNTCVEAMSTGLPVLASPEGGMAEMIDDGVSGWLADRMTPADLAVALRRALDTPADVKARMGRAAADAIRTTCDNSRTIAAQIEFRRGLVAQGAGRSRRIPPQDSSVVWDTGTTVAPAPAAAPGAHAMPRGAAAGRASAGAHGIAVVVAHTPGQDIAACRASLAAQTLAPLTVVEDGPAVMSHLLASMPTLRGVALVDAGCRFDPRFLESAEATLASDEAIGVVANWHDGGRMAPAAIAPSPRRPYQWLRDDVGRCAVFRAEALRAVAWAFAISGGAVSPGDVALAVLLDGWTGVTYPASLSRSADLPHPMADALAATGRARLVPLLRAYFPDVMASDAHEILYLTQARLTARALRPPSPGELLKMPWSQKVLMARRAFANPALTARWAVEHGLRAVGIGGAVAPARSADKA